jgi:hypothetical protein
MISLRIFLWAAGVVVLASGSVAVWVVSHRKSPEERERERRVKLNAIGRLTDGTVLDVNEIQDPKLGAQQLVIYTYDVAGVQYECSQEVTHLRQFVDLHSCRLGLPASVKYDPHNPSNSIVTSETWSGLRK